MQWKISMWKSNFNNSSQNVYEYMFLWNNQSTYFALSKYCKIAKEDESQNNQLNIVLIFQVILEKLIPPQYCIV